MNKFWQWMEEKEYGYKTAGNCFILNEATGGAEDDDRGFLGTKQMLIGYMWEYLGSKLSGEVLEMEPKTNEEIVEYMYRMLENKINGL